MLALLAEFMGSFRLRTRRSWQRYSRKMLRSDSEAKATNVGMRFEDLATDA
jgi:hypothetical protein